MNANELYEKLKKIGKPIIHVDSVEATMNMDISIEELDKHIEILGVHFLLVEILKVDSNDLFFEENKSYIDDYINQNIDDKKTILSIKEKKPTDIGMVSIGFNLNGCVLAFTHIDEWMEHLIQLAKFISNERESEDSNNYWEEQNKIREQKFLEKQEKEKEKEDMIQRVEELTNCDRFQNFKTKGEMLLFWENNIPDLYKTLSRTFMEKMARKYILIVRGS